MNPRAIELLEGAGDPHVHCSPSLVADRKSDVRRLIEAFEQHRMSFAVVKWHHGDSFSMAASIAAYHKGPFRLYGGLVLNNPVGGLNPFAVDVAVTLGARIVWLPTVDAAGHAAAIGQLGGFPFQEVRRRRLPTEGIRITDGDGRVRSEVKEIVEVLEGSDTVLASGHIAADEVLSLKRFLDQQGSRVHLLVNHVDFSVPALTSDQIAELTGPNVWFELAYFSVSRLGHSSVQHMVSLIRRNPTAQFVLASDAGQSGNPIAPEAMLKFIDVLLSAGLSYDEIDGMLHLCTPRLFGRQFEN